MAPRQRSRHGATASTRRTKRPGAVAARKRVPARKKRPSATRPRARSAGARTNRRTNLAPIVIVAMLVAAAWAFYPVARVNYQEQRHKATLEAELAGLQERNGELRAQVDRLKTPEGVEQVARESLGMVKEGENLYVVVDDTSTEPTGVVEPNTARIPEPESSVWQRALDVFFGVR